MSSLSAIEAKLEAESKAFQLLQKGTHRYFPPPQGLISCTDTTEYRAFPSDRVKTTFRITTARKRTCQHCNDSNNNNVMSKTIQILKVHMCRNLSIWMKTATFINLLAPSWSSKTRAKLPPMSRTDLI